MQDTNTLQYEISCLLAQVHKSIFVVGDPDQSIYGWRFANIDNITQITKDFPVRVLGLVVGAAPGPRITRFAVTRVLPW